MDGDRQHYFDTTGTGNSLLMSSPQVLQLIMDSLRYWVTEMHVDGFRFDLASTLARQFAEVDRLSAFFDTKVQMSCNASGKGKISIPFASEEELLHIMEVMDKMK